MNTKLTNQIKSLPDICQSFLFSLQAQKYSECTIKGYYFDLKDWMKFIGNERIKSSDFDLITIDDINAYINTLDISKSTLNRRVSCIKAFYNYMIGLGLIQNSTGEKLKLVSIPIKPMPVLKTEESVKLIQSVDKGNNRNITRDKAILTLNLSIGLRVSELCNINLGDIKENSILIKRKGGKYQELPLNQNCIDAINDYLVIRDCSNEKALFISERKQRISPITVAGLVKKYGRNIGRNDVTTHGLRRSAATRMATNGVNIRIIQKLLNHSNVSVTERYIQVDNSDIAKAIENNSLF